jgi:hypothetical protein
MACINENWDSAGRHLVEDARDVAAIGLASNTGHADTNIDIARTDRLIRPGPLVQGRGPADTGIVKERAMTDCRIGDAVLVAREGIRTDGRVSDAVKVAIKGERPSGRIFFCEVKNKLPAPTAVLYRPVLFSCSDF